MRIDGGFSVDEHWRFLMALNALGAIPTFVELTRVAASPPLRFSLRPKDDRLHRQTQDVFVSHLRYLVDEWIKTGKDASGCGERPNERELTRTLKRTLNEWAAGNKPDIHFEDSGEGVILLPVRKVNFTGEGILITPVEAAKQEAVRRFVVFLDSSYRYQLCKCRSCSKYYYTQRKPRAYLEYGTYCAGDRHQASAARSNEQKRNPAQERRLKAAVEWWGKWPKYMKADPGKQADWIARNVNRSTRGERLPIARNWVTRHRSEIEQRHALKAAPR